MTGVYMMEDTWCYNCDKVGEGPICKKCTKVIYNAS